MNFKNGNRLCVHLRHPRIMNLKIFFRELPCSPWLKSLQRRASCGWPRVPLSVSGEIDGPPAEQGIESRFTATEGADQVYC